MRLTDRETEALYGTKKHHQTHHTENLQSPLRQSPDPLLLNDTDKLPHPPHRKLATPTIRNHPDPPHRKPTTPTTQNHHTLYNPLPPTSPRSTKRNCYTRHVTSADCFAALVDRASILRAADRRFDSHLRRDFFRSSHTSDLKIGTPVAALPGAWRHRVSAGTGWPSFSIQ